jgi:integrase/recombinase XerD
MKFCNVSTFKDLLNIDAQRYITRYVISLRDMKLVSNSIKSRLNPVFHFYEMNDVALNKKKINRFKGEFVKKTRDRAYTHEEIKKILDVCDLRMKVVILLMASTGCRVGALPSLRLRNLQKIENQNLYKITIYEGSNEEYFTYCTPECTSYIDDYLQYRETNGEKLGPDSFLIRDQFDINDIEQIRNKSRGVSIQTFHSIVAGILLKAGLRTIDHTSRHNRKEIMKCHGFRKFFTNQLLDCDAITERRWLLEGHNLKGNDMSYVRISEKRLLEEYMKAVNNLTINEENRLKLKVQLLEGESNEIQNLKRQLNDHTAILSKFTELIELNRTWGTDPIVGSREEFDNQHKMKAMSEDLQKKGVKAAKYYDPF